MIKIIKSEKDKDLLIKDNFTFEIKSVTHNRVYWRCSVRTCKAKIHSPLHYNDAYDSLIFKNDHNHMPDLRDIIKKEEIHKMKMEIKNYLVSPREIILRNFIGAPAEKINACGTYDNLTKILRNYRAKTLNTRPFEYNEIRLGRNLCFTFRDECLYQYGPENYRNVDVFDEFILFYSNSLFNEMKTHDVLCIDGTFKVVPRPFYQLFTISFLKNGHVYPVVYGILKNKNQRTYENLFNTLFKIAGTFKPKVIKTDFELGAINALKSLFPDTKISCCQFHLGQAVIRKVKELKLFYDYKNNQEVRKFVKCLTALSFVRIDKVEETFNQLIHARYFPEILIPLYNYFFTTYIGHGTSANFPPLLWNSNQFFNFEVPRTNNAIEGWHNTFNASFGTMRFSFPILVKQIKNEEEFTQQKIIRSNFGERFRISKKYADFEARLLVFLNRYQNWEGVEFVMELINYIYY